MTELPLEECGTERIAGSSPASQQELDAAREEWYLMIRADRTVACHAGQGVHVWDVGGKTCMCGLTS